MKKICSILLIVASVFFTENTTYAQELNVISASGGYSESPNFSLTFTIGEVIVETSVSGAHHITQGFNQPDIAVVGIQEYQNIDISVYPNPARDILNINTSEETILYIYDIQGKLVRTLDLFDLQTTINVSDLSRGTYSFIFEANGAIANRMKIVIL